MILFNYSLKTVAFISGKKNPATQEFFIRFSIEIKLKNGFKGEIASKIQLRPTYHKTDVCNQIFNGKTNKTFLAKTQ